MSHLPQKMNNLQTFGITNLSQTSGIKTWTKIGVWQQYLGYYLIVISLVSKAKNTMISYIRLKSAYGVPFGVYWGPGGSPMPWYCKTITKKGIQKV